MKTTTYGCTSCGRTSTDVGKWVLRGPDVVVQGVHLGTCGACFGRGAAVAEDCDGSCDGKFRSQYGTYYIAEIRSEGLYGSLKWEPGWSCRSLDCIEQYDPNEDDDCDCPKCDGEHYRTRIVTVVDGERQEATR